MQIKTESICELVHAENMEQNITIVLTHLLAFNKNNIVNDESNKLADLFFLNDGN